MALTVAQHEEILTLLGDVPPLVDKLEARNSGFVTAVLVWLKRSEHVLMSNRLPAASDLAACRARLIEADRGVQLAEVTIIGRLSARKIREAAAADVLGRGNAVLQAVIAQREATFHEAERIALQLVAVARLKGIVPDAGRAQSHGAYLHDLSNHVAADPDLAAAHVHLVGLVGGTDALVFLDRALPSL